MFRLSELRKSKKLTQSDVAFKLGVSRQAYANYEKGSREPDFKTLERMAEYFNVSTDYLLGREQEMFPAPVVSADNAVFPVIGDIAAGFDSIAIESWDGDTVEIPSSYFKEKKKEDFFVLRVKGDSMFPEYRDGDKVLILKQNTLDYNGQTAAVLYDDEIATLKRIEYRPGEYIRLIPINPTVPPIKIDGERLNHCRIIGIPKVLIRNIES